MPWLAHATNYPPTPPELAPSWNIRDEGRKLDGIDKARNYPRADPLVAIELHSDRSGFFQSIHTEGGRRILVHVDVILLIANDRTTEHCSSGTSEEKHYFPRERAFDLVPLGKCPIKL